MPHSFKEGDRVYWTDPADEDRTAAEISEDGTASGPGTITHVQHEEDDAVIAIDKDDGGNVEALPAELEKLADEEEYCPKCGQAWSVHEDDGSCISD
jgi:hypothetical protein